MQDNERLFSKINVVNYLTYTFNSFKVAKFCSNYLDYELVDIHNLDLTKPINNIILIFPIHSEDASNIIKEVIKAAVKSRVIQKIDLSHNNTTDQIFKKILQYISKSNTSLELIIDDLQGISVNEYKQLFTLLHQKSQNLSSSQKSTNTIKVLFPREDLLRYKKEHPNLLTDDKMNELKKLFISSHSLKDTQKKSPHNLNQQTSHQIWKIWNNLILQKYQISDINEAQEPPPEAYKQNEEPLLNSQKQGKKVVLQVPPPQQIASSIKFDLVEFPEVDNTSFLNHFESRYSINYLRLMLDELISKC